MLLAAAVANWHNIGKMNENASGDDFMLYVFPVMLMKPSKFAGRYTLEFKGCLFSLETKILDYDVSVIIFYLRCRRSA